MKKQFLSMMSTSILGGIISVGIYSTVIEPESKTEIKSFDQPVTLAKYEASPARADYTVPEGMNFVNAAEKSTPAVVHIKTYLNPSSSRAPRNTPRLFHEFFSDPRSEGGQLGSGSGVILSADGYIATNNHVIDGADKIEVVLEDKHTFKATLVGTDPTTDLALLKVEYEDALPYLNFGNSDEIKIGEWVLAVGNPYELTSTVTAGIVSAKARNIGILRSKTGLSVESFIQTDAAVNPGNSGGALVDLNGNLIGINSAIASKTGSFTGYSFAIPSELVKKVMDDLRNYGAVQRALIGVQIAEVNQEIADEADLDKIAGVAIMGVTPQGAAEGAGIQEGDIIIKINNEDVNTVSELQEYIARKRPGDVVDVTVNRSGKNKVFNVKLKNTQNTTDIVSAPKNTAEAIEALNAEVQPLSEKKATQLGIDGGLEVTTIAPNSKLAKAGLREGFIILYVDREPITSIDDLGNALRGKRGGILLEGMYPNGEREYVGIGL
ncbi:Do family serine endopeptidase [Flammeovirga kamogawensis]|uniref:Probable periplasmic serine endoprotease DegP-like n=1 Tax=Flammeovirga kamogawensis TaxID=373891 RepID=A0ABX8GTS8_9BACT|nr:Do family serine endopeptidase [Flammeovirga kamogawensis]MBB6460026.1 Do/DeqQ family serine protease [Flammeovirga kamogawensis]QWG06926.1 Do family serine endopeptidase [Flammeovirga kamogawensis]TRX68747.1 Do family serine endopeptidase [Flammeovirga kamogawensis]